MIGRFRFTEFQLLLVPGLATIVGLLTIYLASTGTLDWDWRDIWISLAYMGAVVGITLLFSAIGFRGDQVLFPVTVALSALGLLVIQRLQPALEARGPSYGLLPERQLLYLWIGLGLLAFVVVFIRRIGWMRRYKYSWAVGSILLMLFTMVFGTEIQGARLWLTVGPVTIQPSEITKVALVIFLAGYLAENEDLIVAKYRVGPLNLPPIPYLLPIILMWAFSMLIVVAQNDLGTALLFFGVLLAMVYLASGRLSYVAAGLLAFAAGSYIAYEAFSRVQLRIQNWLDPWQDPVDAGYQQIQSEYAMASGGLFGRGLAFGSPGFIPEVHSDYVFAAIGEELGLLGTFAVLMLFLLLVFRGYYIAMRARDPFGRYLAAGLTSILAVQTLIIIGGTVRLIPLTGITLPFVSAGGSSLLSNFLIIGLLLRISDPRRPS
ncbi:MAG TPA: FtsW/RodA/SpoVE family cell cycle protein [Thermomicrobiales bacterium]|nr:FtsW/RodA/SpoVE family cell cycle protein [Thermomicrobiales bacterium]